MIEWEGEKREGDRTRDEEKEVGKRMMEIRRTRTQGKK